MTDVSDIHEKAIEEHAHTHPEAGIGRIVNYLSADGDILPAMVCRARPTVNRVDLQVFHYNRSVELVQGVEQSDGFQPETWFWPAYTSKK